MTDSPYSAMAEVKRLVRAGKPAQATTLLQRLLGGGTAAPAATPATGPDILARLGATRSEPHAAKRAKPPAAPAVSAPSGARFIARSFRNAAGSRDYKLYVPSGYRGRPLPLIVMLHGCTQSPDDFAAGTRMNELAETGPFLVAYPAQAASANASKCWNWFDLGHQRREGGEPALIAGITRQIMGEYAVDSRRVYVAGLSAGGAAAAILGAAYPDLYAAVGVHSGLPVGAARNVPSAFTAMRNGGGFAAERRAAEACVPTIVFHGDRDTTVHPANGDNVIAQAMVPGLSVGVRDGEVAGGRAYRVTRHADASGRAVLEQWAIRGAGHAWSGGSPSGSYTDGHGPDASREMVRFFLAHANPRAAD